MIMKLRFLTRVRNSRCVISHILFIGLFLNRLQLILVGFFHYVMKMSFMLDICSSNPWISYRAESSVKSSRVLTFGFF